MFLPFISEDAIKALYDYIDEKGGTQHGLDLMSLMPFVNDDVIDQRFFLHIKKGTIHKEMLPFVSDHAVDETIDAYIAGDVNTDMDVLLPFLNKTQIKRLFTYEMNKKS